MILKMELFILRRNNSINVSNSNKSNKYNNSNKQILMSMVRRLKQIFQR